MYNHFVDQKTTNLLRALAIIAVIVIHTAAAQTLFLRQHSLAVPNHFLTLDLLVRFSVPLFVALSGFGLAKSFSEKWKAGGLPNPQRLPGLLRDYFFRRVLRLLPWYFFWGAVIYLYINFIGQGLSTYGSIPVWELFVFGRVDYHLYFVPMIFTLYLVFPLLWLLVKKFPKLTLLIAFLWQIRIYQQLNDTTLSDQQQYIQMASWLFYFVLGIFLASQGETLRSWQKKLWLKLGIIILTVSSFIFLHQHTLRLREIDIDPIIFTRFTQIPVLFYSTGIILSGLAIVPEIISRLSYSPANLLTAFLVSLGELSYLVYLNHTLVLRFLTRSPINITAWPFPLLLLAEITISTLLAKIVQEIFSRLWRQGQVLFNRKG